MRINNDFIFSFGSKRSNKPFTTYHQALDTIHRPFLKTKPFLVPSRNKVTIWVQLLRSYLPFIHPNNRRVLHTAQHRFFSLSFFLSPSTLKRKQQIVLQD
mmetsp:Transcript_36540/g.44088  ORF Transcript_36540/g.44088 Transcript_36540/m.44088 type:complete len:100 (-) Transcript_36540:287-586(-)